MIVVGYRFVAKVSQCSEWSWCLCRLNSLFLQYFYFSPLFDIYHNHGTRNNNCPIVRNSTPRNNDDDGKQGFSPRCKWGISHALPASLYNCETDWNGRIWQGKGSGRCL
eukprot:sb/3477409/